MKYSVVIATHKPRIKEARKQISLIAHEQSKYINKIYIWWVDPSSLPSIDYFITRKDRQKKTIPIIVLKTVSGFITDRFIIPPYIETRTFLILDDDIGATAHKLDAAFEEYKKRKYENRIYGTTDRLCSLSKYDSDYRKYNLILTNTAFLDYDMLFAFNRDEYKNQREYCVNVRNCDDILMNFVVSHEYKKSPMKFDMKTTHVSGKGISTSFNHKNQRDECCKRFHDFFGNDTLLTSDATESLVIY